MNTTFSEIITNFAMQGNKDLNWQSELATSPARFFRAKSAAVINAIPRFNRPPEMASFLTFSAPLYDDTSMTVDAEMPAGSVIESGLKNYELCSVVIVHPDGSATPVESTYDAATGNVTLSEAVSAGSSIDIDAYSDGQFDRELTLEQKRILGLCVVTDWFYRFSNDWLNMTPKIKDKTFDVGSESAQMTANTAKYKEMEAMLNDALLRYEINVAHRNVVNRFGSVTRLTRM